MKITLYGADRCHKTQHYIRFFQDRAVDFVFLDVEKNEEYATMLRSLYTHGKLHFPTITINEKRLRNPSDNELIKWMDRYKNH